MIPGNQLNASLMGAQGMNAPLSVIRQDASIAQVIELAHNLLKLFL